MSCVLIHTQVFRAWEEIGRHPKRNGFAAKCLERASPVGWDLYDETKTAPAVERDLEDRAKAHLIASRSIFRTTHAVGASHMHPFESNIYTLQ